MLTQLPLGYHDNDLLPFIHCARSLVENAAKILWINTSMSQLWDGQAFRIVQIHIENDTYPMPGSRPEECTHSLATFCISKTHTSSSNYWGIMTEKSCEEPTSLHFLGTSKEWISHLYTWPFLFPDLNKKKSDVWQEAMLYLKGKVFYPKRGRFPLSSYIFLLLNDQMQVSQ